MFGCLRQMRLQFAEGQLDRIKYRAGAGTAGRHDAALIRDFISLRWHVFYGNRDYRLSSRLVPSSKSSRKAILYIERNPKLVKSITSLSSIGIKLPPTAYRPEA